MPMSNKTEIGFLLIISGILGIIFSILYESTTLAFISLTLILWSFLFLLALPGKYIESEDMSYFITSTFSALDQIITSAGLQGKAIYIPVQKESYLPPWLDFKNEFIYISKAQEGDKTTIEKAFLKEKEGLCFNPPGLSLLNLMEKKSKLEFHDMDRDHLIEELPSILTDKNEICDEFKIYFNGNEARATIKKPICENLCIEVSKMQSVCPYIGCPLSSAIACILTRSTKKPVRISECLLKDGSLETKYTIIN